MNRSLILALFLALCLSSPQSMSEGKEPITPAHLQYRCETLQMDMLSGGWQETRAYPSSGNKQVDAAIRTALDQMAEKTIRDLPPIEGEFQRKIVDTGAYLNISGNSWLSFLLISRAACDKAQVSVSIQSLAFDMRTGRPLTLSDVFDDKSAVWSEIAGCLKPQLLTYYQDDPQTLGAIDHLLTKEALQNTAFTIETGRIGFHWQADVLYPGRSSVLHAYLYYSHYRPLMTQEAREQTDCSRYRLVSLTFDDGPAGNPTDQLMTTLREYGAKAAFFQCGTMVEKHLDIVARIQDAGSVAAYHSYTHNTGMTKSDELHAELKRFNTLVYPVTGQSPPLMRAPGGIFGPYQKAGMPMPIFQWTVSVSKTNYEPKTIDSIAREMGATLRHGHVVLMHDLRMQEVRFGKQLIASLLNSGAIPVTPQELFDASGISLEANKLYYGTLPERLKQLQNQH